MTLKRKNAPASSQGTLRIDCSVMRYWLAALAVSNDTSPHLWRTATSFSRWRRYLVFTCWGIDSSSSAAAAAFWMAINCPLSQLSFRHGHAHSSYITSSSGMGKFCMTTVLLTRKMSRTATLKAPISTASLPRIEPSISMSTISLQWGLRRNTDLRRKPGNLGKASKPAHLQLFGMGSELKSKEVLNCADSISSEVETMRFSEHYMERSTSQ